MCWPHVEGGYILIIWIIYVQMLRHDLNRWCCLWQKLQMLYSIANEHMSYDPKCIECVHGLDMITPQNSIHFLASGAHAVCYVWFVGGEDYHMKFRSVLKMLWNVDQVLATMVRNCLLESVAWLEELWRRIFFFCYLHSILCECDLLSLPYWQLSDSPDCFLKWFCKVADVVFRDEKGVKTTLKPPSFLFHCFVVNLLY